MKRFVCTCEQVCSIRAILLGDCIIRAMVALVVGLILLMGGMVRAEPARQESAINRDAALLTIAYANLANWVEAGDGPESMAQREKTFRSFEQYVMAVTPNGFNSLDLAGYMNLCRRWRTIDPMTFAIEAGDIVSRLAAIRGDEVSGPESDAHATRERLSAGAVELFLLAYTRINGANERIALAGDRIREALLNSNQIARGEAFFTGMSELYPKSDSVRRWREEFRARRQEPQETAQTTTAGSPLARL